MKWDIDDPRTVALFVGVFALMFWGSYALIKFAFAARIFPFGGP